MGKTIIYQILPRLWGNACGSPRRNGSLRENGSGTFSAVDTPTLAYIKGLGVSHVWYTGVLRHATSESFEGCPASVPAIVKGKAGSPYAITDYYDVNPYLADDPASRMAEFEALVKRTHEAGLKLLIDFVPNHVSRDYGRVGQANPSVEPLGKSDDPTMHWKPSNDFFYYPGEALHLPAEAIPEGSPGYYENPAKASGNCFTPSPGKDDWYETVRLNYCDFPTPTWDKMLDVVLFWCRKGIDGFRCDMVEMVPWQFMKWLVAEVKREFPDTIFVGEVYDKGLYSKYVNVVGFDLLYDKSGLYDSLRSIICGGASAKKVTWNWQSLGSLQPNMLNFLENHDEQRFASAFFGRTPDRAFAALAAGLLFNRSAFMLYCGQEVGEEGMDEEGFSGRDGRTSIFDWWSVGSLARLHEYIHSGSGLGPAEAGVLARYREILAAASSEAAFSDGGTFDLCYCNYDSPGFDPDRHFAFLRSSGTDTFLVLCNFSESPSCLSLTVPREAFSCLGIPMTEKLNPQVRIELDVPGQGYSVVRL